MDDLDHALSNLSNAVPSAVPAIDDVRKQRTHLQRRVRLLRAAGAAVLVIVVLGSIAVLGRRQAPEQQVAAGPAPGDTTPGTQVTGGHVRGNLVCPQDSSTFSTVDAVDGSATPEAARDEAAAGVSVPTGAQLRNLTWLAQSQSDESVTYISRDGAYVIAATVVRRAPDGWRVERVEVCT